MILTVVTGLQAAMADTPSCEPKYTALIEQQKDATDSANSIGMAGSVLGVGGLAMMISSYNPAGLGVAGVGVSSSVAAESIPGTTNPEVIQALSLIREARIGDGEELRSLTSSIVSRGGNVSRGEVALAITELDAKQAFCQGDQLMNVNQVEDAAIKHLNHQD